MKRTYYTLTTRIEAGWNLPCQLKLTKTGVTGAIGPLVAHPSIWREAPHVTFANLAYGKPLTSIAVRGFIREHGVVGTDKEPQVREEFEVSNLLFSYTQDSFRRVWREGKASAVFFPAGAEDEDRYSLSLLRDPDGFALYPANCLTYMRFLLARDLDEKRARFCPNRTCKAPYFIGRTNQIFCSHKCASEESVRRWRKKHAK
jgi:hypothetical protein